MKKMLLFAVMLLLIFTLLPTTVVAPKPDKPSPKAEIATVVFSGDDVTSQELTLTFDTRGSTTRLYPTGEQTVQLTFDFGLSDELVEETGYPNCDDSVGIIINKKTQETTIVYKFYKYKEGDDYEGWFKYQLEVFGEWIGEDLPYGEITVDDEDFEIWSMIYPRTSKNPRKGAIAPRKDVKVWSGPLDFSITITPPPP